jgi:hypothetical protein
MVKGYDSNFYVVCATIIPVLFLAAAIQGNAYKNVLEAAIKAAKTESGDRLGAKLYAFILSRVLQLLSYCIWSAGAIGEFLALLTLYQGHEDTNSRPVVFLSTMLLVLTVAAGPLDSYLKVRVAMRGERPRSAPDPSQDATPRTVVAAEDQTQA